jgi:hypothetical protein
MLVMVVLAMVLASTFVHGTLVSGRRCRGCGSGWSRGTSLLGKHRNGKNRTGGDQQQYALHNLFSPCGFLGLGSV